MSKIKDIIKNFKISKSLGDYRAVIEKGDKLTMFDNTYVVVSPSDASFIILEDENKMKFSLPANRVDLLLQKGIIKKQRSFLSKAIAPKGGKVVGTPKSTLRTDAYPVGTVRPDPKGGMRKKIAMHPSVWVHVAHGTTHPSHSSEEEHHPITHEHDVKEYNMILSNIHSHAHPEDHEQLKGLWLDYKKAQQTYDSLKTVLNTPDLGNGTPLKRVFGGTGEANRLFSLNDKAQEKLNTFKKALVTSVKKQRTEKQTSKG